MKKEFMNPTLRKYELNQQEKIVASITWNDGQMSSTWHFVHTHDTSGNNVSDSTPDVGCYALLIATFVTGTSYLVESDWYKFLAPISATDYPQYQEYLACSSKFLKET